MAEEKLLEAIGKAIERNPLDGNAYYDMVSTYADLIRDGKDGAEKRARELHQENKAFRGQIAGAMKRAAEAGKYQAADMLNSAYWYSMLLDAPVDFDAYCQYIEKDRPPEKRFYLPRRKTLLPIARDMEKLETGDLKLLTISLPPGVGKSTLALFFISWLGGKHPDKAILTFSYDSGIVRGFYEEILRIIDPAGEYLCRDVFTAADVPLAKTNAKELRIDLGKAKRFETFQFSSVGAGNAGKYRASELLYCDDLCSGIEEALSKERMDKLWRTYTTDLRQRTSGDPPELHIATRWSVWDVIGRIQQQYMDQPSEEVKFISIPALDENDESNFDYPRIADRFTTKRYHELRDSMDPTDWRALYMNEPIEREGQLYHPDELRRFFELPEKEPDAIVAVCDTKAKGSDYAFMPVIYEYGRDCYVADCVCDNGEPGIVEERLVQMLLKHRVQQAQFESNSAGWKVAENVQDKVRERGGRTKITIKPTTANKETKIVVNAPTVKERFLFLDSGKYKPNSDYGRMMSFLVNYTMAGKNKHDDVPDGMAMAALYVEGIVAPKVTVFARPF